MRPMSARRHPLTIRISLTWSFIPTATDSAGRMATPSLQPIEERLAATPRIGVPTFVLHGGSDGVAPAESSEGHAPFFSGPYVRRLLPVAGHVPAPGTPGPIVRP